MYNRVSRVGFCGVDETIDIFELELFLKKYAELNIEWSILFHHGKTGNKFPTLEWVRMFSSKLSFFNHELSAHLCGDNCIDFINGKLNFLYNLKSIGFKRFQLNITKLNGVNIESFELDVIPKILENIRINNDVEFIFQYNKETKFFCEHLIKFDNFENKAKNMCFLFDESKGTGELSKKFPKPIIGYRCGYTGGINESTLNTFLKNVEESICGYKCKHERYNFFLDMESGIRNEQNKFCLKKCGNILNLLFKRKTNY